MNQMSESGMALVSRRRLIRNGLLLATNLAWTPWALRGQSESNASTDDSHKAWTIENEAIMRRVVFHPGKGLYTEQFSDLETHADYILPETVRLNATGWSYMAQEFSFRCNGQVCTGAGTDFNLMDAHQETSGKGKTLTIRLRHKSLGLEVSVIYRVYNSHAAIRKHLVLRNTGADLLHLSHFNIEAIGISLGPENETTLLTQYGTVPREIFYTGRSEDAGLLLANGRTGKGLAIISEVPGYMKRTEVSGWDDPERVRIGVLYDTDLMPFERTLAGGEEFTSAAASLIAYQNSGGFHDPHWRIPSYTSEVLIRRVNRQGPPWIYNTWEPFERGINHDIVMELLEAASAMGMDIFTIDDGWQQEYGENAVNLTSFPGGLKSIQDAVEEKGMRLGLWIPLAAIGKSTAEYRAHPEWASLDRDGNAKTTSTMGGEKVVMCMATGFRDAAADRIIDAIERFHLAYVKLDITTIFNAYGEAPGCWAKGHDHRNWAESLNMIYEGIGHMTGRIYARHPDVLLDLTFELWGQKHVIDAGLLAAGDLDWMSNVDDRTPDSAGPTQARQLLYQRAASMPVESMLIGNIHAELPTIQESFATAIGSAPLLLGDLRKLSAADRQWFHEKITWFKALRKRVPISQSFFPLGASIQPSAAEWDGFARLAHTGEGIIALFKNKSQASEATVQLPLMPGGRFNVRSIISGHDLGVFGLSDWKRGVPVKFPSSGQVEVLEIRSAG